MTGRHPYHGRYSQCREYRLVDNSQPDRTTPMTHPKGDTTMTFSTISISDLPKREAPQKTFDLEAANAILALVSVPGQAASDSVAYADMKSARAAANAAKRLLSHVVTDETKKIETRIFGIADGKPAAVKGATALGYCLYLTDKPVELAEAAVETKPAKK